MPTSDTIDLSLVPFYQWDSIPYSHEAEAPDMGVATDSCFRQLLMRDSVATNDTLTRTSLFTGHTLAPSHPATEPRNYQGAPIWVFVLLLTLVTLVTIYLRQHKIRYSELLHSLFDSRAMDRMLRNTNLLRPMQLVPIGILTTATLMLPVHLMALERTDIVGYLLLTVAVAAAYLLRNGLMHLLAVIFDDESAVNFYITGNYLYHLTLTTLCLPLTLLLVYLPFGSTVMLYILLGVVILEFVFRLFRGLKVFLTQSTNAHFYLFYYLCIVELAPILVLIKWITA